ncbi:hypothetical protein EJ04DRAFT_514646 [Polyplosphaeria fusca]|uniref:Uncharacterized protein n=1 Tax=Polyplosphaeria fusca TaxID=682080 RepID=A0A9P4QUM5_9PLEO|nr:hypothetical protein EJ04DRAFT_514646 [Polyplosphaeria fusca]
MPFPITSLCIPQSHQSSHIDCLVSDTSSSILVVVPLVPLLAPLLVLLLFTFVFSSSLTSSYFDPHVSAFEIPWG